MARQYIPARYEWHWSSLVGSVQGALRHYELPWESWWVSGALGEAFAVVDVDTLEVEGRAFARLGRPPGRLDGLAESLRALGLHARVHVRDLRRQRRPVLFERRLKAALNAGRPALAYGAGVSVGFETGGREFGLVVGYDDERASYRVDGPLTAEAGPWLRFDALGGRDGDDDRWLAVAALSPGEPDAPAAVARAGAAARSAGAAEGLRRWAAVLEGEKEVDSQGHAYRVQQLAGSRGEAARFWRWVVEGVGPAAGEAGAAAEGYAASALALSTFATLFPYPMGGDVRSAGARTAGARALRRAAAEEEAIARLAAIRGLTRAALRPPERI